MNRLASKIDRHTVKYQNCLHNKYITNIRNNEACPTFGVQ